MTVVFAYLDEPPFCAPAADGPVGCDVEVAFAVLRAIGIERIETRLVTFAELLPGVASGAWQINTPLFITEERARLVDFSRPVWSLADGLMVQAGNPKRLTSYRALAAHADARLVVVADQVQEQRALAAGSIPHGCCGSRPSRRRSPPCAMAVPTPTPAWRWRIAVSCARRRMRAWRWWISGRMAAWRRKVLIRSRRRTPI